MEYFGADKKSIDRNEIITDDFMEISVGNQFFVPINSAGTHLKIKFYLDNITLTNINTGETLIYRIGQYFEVEHSQSIRLRTPEFIYDLKYVTDSLNETTTAISFINGVAAPIPHDLTATLIIKSPVFSLSFYHDERTPYYDFEIYAEIFVPVTREPDKILITTLTGEMIWVDQKNRTLPLPTEPKAYLVSDENGDAKWQIGGNNTVAIWEINGEPSTLGGGPNSFLITDPTGVLIFEELSKYLRQFTENMNYTPEFWENQFGERTQILRTSFTIELHPSGAEEITNVGGIPFSITRLINVYGSYRPATVGGIYPINGVVPSEIPTAMVYVNENGVLVLDSTDDVTDVTFTVEYTIS